MIFAIMRSVNTNKRGEGMYDTAIAAIHTCSRRIQVGPAEGSKLDMLNCDIIIGIIKHGEYQNDEKK